MPDAYTYACAHPYMYGHVTRGYMHAYTHACAHAYTHAYTHVYKHVVKQCSIGGCDCRWLLGDDEPA